MTWQILTGDCVEVMADMAEASVDAIVTDPPYGLEFMGKEWDSFDRHGPRSFENLGQGLPHGPGSGRGTDPLKDKPRFSTMGPRAMLALGEWHQAWATQALRVLKPGGHLLAFGGTRTIHRLVCAIEDAGFEIRDMLSWNYGSGFPKSLNVSATIEAQIPVRERCVCAQRSTRIAPDSRDGYPSFDGSDGGRLPLDGGTDLASVPSLGDARERSHDDQPVDDPVVEPGHTPTARTGHPSSEDSRGQAKRQGACSRSAGSTQSDMASNTSRGESTVEHRTDDRIPDTLRSDDGSRTWNKHISPCHVCGGWFVEPGFGTALKPAWEGITLARKPLAGTVAANVLAHGTGALNIDGTRIGSDRTDTRHGGGIRGNGTSYELEPDAKGYDLPPGRWPANVVLDDEAAALLDEQSGESKSPPVGSMGGGSPVHKVFGDFAGVRHENGYGDRGGASRFFKVVRPEGENEACLLASLRPECQGLWSRSAITVGTPSTTSAQQVGGSVPVSAARTIGEPSGQGARSAVPLCDSCVTAIARSVAASRQGRDPVEALGLGSTSELSLQTLSQSLALLAASLPSTDTTPTTASLSLWCGYVRHAIAGTTSSAVSDPSTGSVPTRFRYDAKADRAERNRGLEHRSKQALNWSSGTQSPGTFQAEGTDRSAQNHHPTVKPVDLMQWLCRLITPPHGLVLDPFTGSGSTGIAALREGFDFIGIEREPEYVEIARDRIIGDAPLFNVEAEA